MKGLRLSHNIEDKIKLLIHKKYIVLLQSCAFELLIKSCHQFKQQWTKLECWKYRNLCYHGQIVRDLVQHNAYGCKRIYLAIERLLLNTVLPHHKPW